MKHLKNPELRKELLICGAAALALAALSLLISPLCALAVLGTGLVFTYFHVFFARRRYGQIAELSRSVDRVLHGQDQLLEDNAEGELAILRSEISKMTLRLKESADRLQDEKQELTRALADVSHQLRTPLTSMNLTLSLLAEADEAEKRLRLTRELKRSLERIDWLVETLLKLSKLDAGVAVFAPEPIRAADLTGRALRPLRIPMELRGQRFSLEGGDTELRLDPAWTAEALGNLLKNCVEHTPEGGSIRVTARKTPIFTELTVCDSGPGIDPADLPHLFERFYRGKNADEHSVGIGLALARQIVTEQNGTLRASNSPEGGASFTMRFYVGAV
ncbi:MAG: HAMP domain-containing histidine kinase [Oscillospiraceae bacterium]|nr:HAMP domain-containing histidine kinase [Oscillospiraceae bacterium]